jgi:hypothetical protein
VASPPPPGAPAVTLAQFVEQQKRIVASGQFEYLGRVIALLSPQGGMQFDRKGPHIGVARGTGQIVFLDPWGGVPDIRLPQEKACPDCAAPCDECEKGTRTCTLYGCGGTGVRKLKQVECPKCVGVTGSFSLKCKECKGAGQVFLEEPCPACEKGRAKCPLCFGSGTRGLGTLNGSKDRNSPSCPTCEGQCRAFISQPQPLDPFVLGVQEGFTLVGPIIKAVVHQQAAGNMGPNQRKMYLQPGGASASFHTVEIAPDAHGNLLALMLPDTKPGNPVYGIGGSVSSPA